MTDIREPNDWRAGDLAYRWRQTRVPYSVHYPDLLGKIGSIVPVCPLSGGRLQVVSSDANVTPDDMARVLTPDEVALLPVGAKVAVLRGWRDYERGDVVELTSADSHWCGRAVNTRAKEMLLALIELPSSEDKIRAEKIEAATSRIEAAEAELERARRELEELA